MRARFDDSWAAFSDAVNVRRDDLRRLVSHVDSWSGAPFPPYIEDEAVIRDLQMSVQRILFHRVCPYPCCNGDDGQADHRGQQHQTSQLFPDRDPHLDHNPCRQSSLYVACERRMAGAEARSRRVSVSCATRERADAGNGAVEGVSCAASHSLRRVSGALCSGDGAEAVVEQFAIRRESR